jgi:hypothetical protein
MRLARVKSLPLLRRVAQCKSLRYGKVECDCEPTLLAIKGKRNVEVIFKVPAVLMLL